MTLPRVSIIIPVYNGSNYVKEAIDSALGQTYGNFEVIVVNDGSCDDGATRAIALEYGDKIRYFEKENGGVSSALNLGIREMTGEYFSWLSHDDKYEAGKLENSVGFLSRFEDTGKVLAMCGGYYINSNSEKIRDMNFEFSKNKMYSGPEVLHYLLTHGVLDACCLLIPKRAFEECGYFNEDLRYNQDALMWYKIFSSGYSLVVDSEHRDVMYRLHATQTSKTRRDLLIRDSRVLSEIIAPTFAKLSTKKTNLIKMFALRNARVDCKDAVEVCISAGKSENVLSAADVLVIRCGCLWGKLRNIIKAVYHRLLIK